CGYTKRCIFIRILASLMHKNRINRNRFQPSNFSFGAVCKIFFRMKILGSPHVAGFYGAGRRRNVL
ncbi:MAG TPA: hypothetical protein DCE73_14060, partial [Paraprevotella xylaniphila]|nr:hypothetical protein [Paraprevotella xylaniphila]